MSESNHSTIESIVVHQDAVGSATLIFPTDHKDTSVSRDGDEEESDRTWLT